MMSIALQIDCKLCTRALTGGLGNCIFNHIENRLPRKYQYKKAQYFHTESYYYSEKSFAELKIRRRDFVVILALR